MNPSFSAGRKALLGQSPAFDSIQVSHCGETVGCLARAPVAGGRGESLGLAGGFWQERKNAALKIAIN